MLSNNAGRFCHTILIADTRNAHRQSWLVYTKVRGAARPNLLAQAQLSFSCNPLVWFTQMLYPISKLTVLILWKSRRDRVRTTRGVLTT